MSVWKKFTRPNAGKKTWVTKNVPNLCDDRRDLKKRRFEAVNKRVQRPSRRKRRMRLVLEV